MGWGFLHYGNCDIIQLFLSFEENQTLQCIICTVSLKDAALRRVDWLWRDPSLACTGKGVTNLSTMVWLLSTCLCDLSWDGFQSFRPEFPGDVFICPFLLIHSSLPPVSKVVLSFGGSALHFC